MRWLTRLSMALIAISLLSPLWTSLYLIPFVQPEREDIIAGKLHYMFSYENFVHEAGFARMAISILALLILFIPFRKGERWAFAALVILAITYYVPVFLYDGIPNLGTYPFFQKHWHLPENDVSHSTIFWTSVFFNSCLLLGILIASPKFLRASGRN